jgi:hypothetical protein
MRVRPRWAAAGSAAVLLPLLLPPATTAQATPLAVPLSACVPSDNGDPVVSTATTTPSTVDTTRRTASVVLTATITDTGGPGPATGVHRVTAQLWGQRGKTAPENPVPMRPGADDTWTAALALPRGSVPGSYAAHLVVHDGAGNVALVGAGTDAALPQAGVTVTSVADTGAPRLVSLRLGRPKVDTRTRAAHVTVTARAEDARAGVKRVLVTAGNDRRSTSQLLDRVSGTAADGVWRSTLTIPRWLGDTTWRLQVGMVDAVVNVRSYGRTALGRLGGHVDRTITVRSRSDGAAPRAAITVTPSSVDVRSQAQLVAVRVHARDARSGVRRVHVRLLDPGRSDGVLDVPLVRASGSRHHGVWQAVVTLPACGTIAGTSRTQLDVTDRSLRTRKYRAGLPTLEVAANDNLAPSVVRTSSSSGAPVLDFDEDVTGITATSAPVIDQVGGAPVAGVWGCTDATGSVADCATGAVRRATFSPAQPALGQLFVLLNPEHSLGVTDLAGNPAGRRYTL